MKKFLIGIFSAILLTLNVNATENNTTNNEKEKINVYVFTKDGCPHCEHAKSFFKSIKDEYGKYFNLTIYEVYDASWNADDELKSLMDNVAEKRGDKVNGVPYIVIGSNNSWPGYQASYDEDIKKAIVNEYNNEDYFDLVKSLAPKESDHSKDTIIVVAILVLIVGGVGTYIYISRKRTK